MNIKDQTNSDAAAIQKCLFVRTDGIKIKEG